MLASTPPPPVVAVEGLRKRVTRFCLAALGIAYLRRTWTSFFQQRAMLRLQQTAAAAVATASKAGMAIAGRPPRRSDHLLWRALTYTLTSQLIAASEFLLPLVKPLLAVRIGRLLVWKGPRVQPNAVYGPHTRNTVDVYGIESATGHMRKAGDVDPDARKPVLVFVHGGAWSFGHKWQYGLVGEYLASTLGVLVAVVNYRTYPMGHVQDMVEDVERAVRGLCRCVLVAQCGYGLVCAVVTGDGVSAKSASANKPAMCIFLSACGTRSSGCGRTATCSVVTRSRSSLAATRPVRASGWQCQENNAVWREATDWCPRCWYMRTCCAWRAQERMSGL